MEGFESAPDARRFGACLYVPAVRDLVSVVRGERLGDVSSIIFCTEDAIDVSDLPRALENLAAALSILEPQAGRNWFVRVRDPMVLRRVLEMPGSHLLTGFVLPKVHAGNFPAYWSLLEGTRHLLMPTLETREAFSESSMTELRRLMSDDGIRRRIACLRIGGNDLLSLLGLRRPRGKTVYQTPIGDVIARLVTWFRPWGFQLAAPVFEYLDDAGTLSEELEIDRDWGLCPKAAIHPDQVGRIEEFHRVHPAELDAAVKILQAGSTAVFRFQDSMCEPATHLNWARTVVIAADRFGTRPAPSDAI
ncbi:MAG TPA: HpcH/HpaI aldolase/citrate lyase family protein [Fibrobacteria bacterium]|nr:HpcH/HpaI aldolase/citrate lyase family protein [Fibrobacteria bacterium]HOX52639.1 HpcH/HpaI aldolase/citrate lyase family protein [Fibrobacteria bacterium]